MSNFVHQAVNHGEYNTYFKNIGIRKRYRSHLGLMSMYGNMLLGNVDKMCIEHQGTIIYQVYMRNLGYDACCSILIYGRFVQENWRGHLRIQSLRPQSESCLLSGFLGQLLSCNCVSCLNFPQPPPTSVKMVTVYYIMLPFLYVGFILFCDVNYPLPDLLFT